MKISIQILKQRIGFHTSIKKTKEEFYSIKM